MQQILTLLLSVLFHAQAQAQNVTELEVPEITVTGEAKAVAAPAASELSGARLERKRQATLGETLAHEAGVASSEFGQSASRPVIRGQEGDRVKILQNGTGVLDASGASQDHAVAIEPLSLDKVEIVRGPGALLYGNNAIGGVVNMTTNRIPEKVPGVWGGKLDSRFSTVDLGRSLGFGVDGGAGGHWSLHADGSGRASDDYHAHGASRVENSSNRTGSGAIGGSYSNVNGYLGASVSDYESTYGTLVEKFTHINLLQQRVDLAGEIRDLGFFKSIRAKNSYSHYRHDEVEQGGQLGTSFKNDGDELRFEGRHRPVEGVNGIVGGEFNTFRFSAQGEEAFIPTTDNRMASVFLFEEAPRLWWFKPSIAARLEAVTVTSRDDVAFGVGQEKRFSAPSLALGATYSVSSTQTLGLNLAYTERAPNYEELFAKGPHAATAQYEIGDTTLGKERSQSAELNYKFAGESSHLSLSAFIQDASGYISLAPTGTKDPTGHTQFDVFRYSGVDARFYGAEAEYRRQLPAWIPGGALEFEFKADTLRAYNRQNGENLPRIAPVRETVGLNYRADRFSADLAAERSEKQTLTAPNETATGAYTWVNLGFEAPVKTEWARFTLSARVNNIFDVEGKNHVSVIKDAAPLPGRNFIVGLQAAF